MKYFCSYHHQIAKDICENCKKLICKEYSYKVKLRKYGQDHTILDYNYCFLCYVSHRKTILTNYLKSGQKNPYLYYLFPLAFSSFVIAGVHLIVNVDFPLMGWIFLIIGIFAVVLTFSFIHPLVYENKNAESLIEKLENQKTIFNQNSNDINFTIYSIDVDCISCNHKIKLSKDDCIKCGSTTADEFRFILMKIRKQSDS